METRWRQRACGDAAESIQAAATLCFKRYTDSSVCLLLLSSALTADRHRQAGFVAASIKAAETRGTCVSACGSALDRGVSRAGRSTRVGGGIACVMFLLRVTGSLLRLAGWNIRALLPACALLPHTAASATLASLHMTVRHRTYSIRRPLLRVSSNMRVPDCRAAGGPQDTRVKNAYPFGKFLYYRRAAAACLSGTLYHFCETYYHLLLLPGSIYAPLALSLTLGSSCRQAPCAAWLSGCCRSSRRCCSRQHIRLPEEQSSAHAYAASAILWRGRASPCWREDLPAERALVACWATPALMPLAWDGGRLLGWRRRLGRSWRKTRDLERGGSSATHWTHLYCFRQQNDISLRVDMPRVPHAMHGLAFGTSKAALCGDAR